MRIRPVKFTVYKDRANIIRPVVIVRDQDGVESPMSWSGVARMVLEVIAATPILIDTATAPAAIDYSVDGQLTLRIGALLDVVGLADGEYYANLTAIDTLDVETEIWSAGHPETPVILRFVSSADL